jgi:predicted permease
MILQDVRYAARSMRRAPLLAIATVLTLALGIGLNVGIFTVLEGLLFRARVDKDPKTFVHLSPEYKETTDAKTQPWAISTRDFRAYSANPRTLSELAAWSNVGLTVGTSDGDSVLALLVTCNFFSVYGLEHPKMGRLFAPSECSTPGSAPVAVLGEEIWRDRLGSDPQIIGKIVRFNRVPFTVTGIAPAGFSGRLRGPGVWIPYTMEPMFFQGRDLFREPARWLTVEGRLRPGYSKLDAQAELAVIAAQQDRLQPGRQTIMQLTNGSFAEEPSLRGELYWMGPLIMGAMTLMLLIACTNVTVLHLSRAVTRQREMGIRLSMGAGRGRLMQMLLTESLFLSVLAGGISAFFAYEAPAIFAKTLGSARTPVYQLSPDFSTLAYLGSIVLAAACMAGLSPAAESLRVDLATSMKSGGSGSGSGRAKRRQRSALVAAQVAMSFVLLSGAGLFIRAQRAIFDGDPGFETRHVILLPLQTGTATINELVHRVRAIPGVEAVAFGSPFSQSEIASDLDEIRLPGEAKGSGRRASVTAVSADYFDVLRIPLADGRTFSRAEEGGATRVVVVSQSLARVFWPGKEPVGQRLVLADGLPAEVVGVARDVQSERIGVVDGPHLYQVRDPRSTGDTLLIRFAGDARPIELAVRSAARELDPEMIVAPKTLRAIIDELADRFGALVRLVSALAGSAVLLATVGIYGVIAFTVSQRTKELGIRMALGATRSLIVKMVLVSGGRPVVMGLGGGLIVAVFAARVTARVLQHTPIALNPGDPVAYLAMGGLLALVAALAMFRPALRAAGADPVRALREE